MRQNKYKILLGTVVIVVLTSVIIPFSHDSRLSKPQTELITVPIASSTEGVSLNKKLPQAETKSTEPVISGSQLEENTRSENKISVIFGVNGQVLSHEVENGSTAFELMDDLRNQNEITFQSKDYSGIGQFIYSINGQKEDPRHGYYWTLYINGKESVVGVSAYVLKDNDIINWKLESRQ